jgi:hypothetical protein
MVQHLLVRTGLLTLDDVLVLHDIVEGASGVDLAQHMLQDLLVAVLGAGRDDVVIAHGRKPSPALPVHAHGVGESDHW